MENLWEYFVCFVSVRDMQQIYDMWLALAAHNQQAEGAMYSQSNPEEKYIAMPTDYAEPMVGLQLIFRILKNGQRLKIIVLSMHLYKKMNLKMHPFFLF